MATIAANRAADGLTQNRDSSFSTAWQYHHAGGCMITCVRTYTEFDKPLGRAEEHNMTLQQCQDQASVELNSKYLVFFKQPYGETRKYSCIWYDAARKECGDSSAMACNNGKDVTKEYESAVYMRLEKSKNNGFLQIFPDRKEMVNESFESARPHARDDDAEESEVSEVADAAGRIRMEVTAKGVFTDVTESSASDAAARKGVWRKDHDGGCMRVCDQTHTEKDKPLGRAQEHIETLTNCKTMASTDARTRYLVYLVKNGKGECLWYDAQKTDCGRRGSVACELDVDITKKYNVQVYRLDNDDNQPEK